jgi:hypothetical protein
MREIYPLQLNSGAVTATGFGVEVDLSKYYVSPGKREMKALMAAYADTANAASDTFSIDVKMQESATTVDSDFVDITGAAFTQVTEVIAAAGVLQQLHFQTLPASVYLREHHTIAGSGIIHLTAAALVTLREA